MRRGFEPLVVIRRPPALGRQWKRRKAFVLQISVQCLDVAVAFDDLHDLERVIEVAKENHVALEGYAADVGTQFGTSPAEGTGQCCELAAMLTQSVDKPPADNEIAAFAGDVFKDIHQVCFRRRQHSQPRQVKSLPWRVARPWLQGRRRCQHHWPRPLPRWMHQASCAMPSTWPRVPRPGGAPRGQPR